MATAKINKTTKKVMKEVEETTENILLEVTKEEAAAMRAVFGNVGGSPSRTRRGLIDSVDQVLGRVLVPDSDSDIERGHGSIYFKETV
jgi:hypothetical protein